jgi:hypothetical protein
MDCFTYSGRTGRPKIRLVRGGGCFCPTMCSSGVPFLCFAAREREKATPEALHLLRFAQHKDGILANTGDRLLGNRAKGSQASVTRWHTPWEHTQKEPNCPENRSYVIAEVA